MLDLSVSRGHLSPWKARIQMVAYRLLTFVLMLAGCGAESTLGRPGFRTIDGSPSQVEWANVTLDVFRNLVDVDASMTDVAFVNTWEEQRDACHGFAGCTDLEVDDKNVWLGYSIHTYWPENWTEQHPAILAHELCHVYYYQTHENGDPGHTHIECFDRITGFAAETAMIVTRDYGASPPVGG